MTLEITKGRIHGVKRVSLQCRKSKHERPKLTKLVRPDEKNMVWADAWQAKVTWQREGSFNVRSMVGYLSESVPFSLCPRFTYMFSKQKDILYMDVVGLERKTLCLHFVNITTFVLL